MLLRIVASIFLVAFMFLVFFLGEYVYGLVIAAFAVIGTWELYKATEHKGNHPVGWIAPFFAIPILMHTFSDKLDFLGISFYGVATLTAMVCVFQHKKHTIIDGIITVFSGVVVTSMFYNLLAIYKLGDDKVVSAALLFVALIGAWSTDIFAYLVGVTIGKHKLCPEISPKKSVEGSIAGVIGVIVSMTLYCKLALPHFVPAFADVPVWAYLLLGLFCGLISQIGDLTASLFKRYFGVKDYGKIFPGHGGILDRFDSLIFVAPVVYCFLQIAVYG